MSNTQSTITESYWTSFQFTDQDLDYLYNYLLENETPQNPKELVLAIIKERIKFEIERSSVRQRKEGLVYLPKDEYEPHQKLLFPSLNWQSGVVIQSWPGINPDCAPFSVIEVEMDNGEIKSFASNYSEHPLNNPQAIEENNPLFSPEYIAKQYGETIETSIVQRLEKSPDLVRIAGCWFPQALLVDVNIGYLNLAEALLDMENGGPLSTQKILDQIELPTDVNLRLTEFSLNLALQEDGRFDEVGASGEVLWYLRRLEPESVRETPVYIRPGNYAPIDEDLLSHLKQFDKQVVDELQPELEGLSEGNRITISLLFPHWRSGTLPLSGKLSNLFPWAFESPRIRFTFRDGENNQEFPGWVVRTSKYVYGLGEWYKSQGVIPGSLIHLEKGQEPGEVILRTNKKRPSREWIRTALVGADGGIVFAMLKQMVSCTVDERMGIAIPDVSAIDAIWQQSNRQKGPLDQTIFEMMQELAKINSQGHVHVQELYAAVNLIRRCPPGQIISVLIQKPWAQDLGNLYYRLDETSMEKVGKP